MKGSAAETAEAQLICKHTARLIEAAREIAPDYARRSAPVGSHVISQLLTRTGCTLTFAPLDDACAGMTLPRVSGVCTVVINTGGAEVDEIVTLRHELGHVLAGDVDEPTYMDDDEMSWTERVADLFALADVVSGGEIRMLRRRRRSWAEVAASLAGLVESFAAGWSPERIRDRARLRLVLYRTQGI